MFIEQDDFIYPLMNNLRHELYERIQYNLFEVYVSPYNFMPYWSIEDQYTSYLANKLHSH